MQLQAIQEDPELISIEALDQEIVSLSTRMTTQEYEFLVLIRTFDERGGWLKWGSVSCADWLHWRCDLSLSAAREKIRVARALQGLVKISTAFQQGGLSYSKVRALTRVADRFNEDQLLAFALNVSASLVEQHCQQRRNVHQDSVDTASRAHQRRSLTAFRKPQSASMTLTVEIPLDEGELILNALDKILANEESSADQSSSYRSRQADALVELCKMALGAESLRGGVKPGQSPTTNNSDQYQVVIHVDESALSNDPAPDARSDLPVETVRRLCCDGTLIPITGLLPTTDNGQTLDIGRKRRTLPTALKRAVWARDRHCRFPGCSHARFVDAHHVQHWAQGGATSLENLMLLCSHHHRLVHEGGFSIFSDQHGEQRFRRPDGRTIPACGCKSADQQDEYANPDPSAEGTAFTTQAPDTVRMTPS